MSLSLSPIGPWVVVLALVAVLFAALGWGPARGRTTTGRRRVLLALRLSVILLAAVALLRPTVVYTSMRKQSATLVLLIDRSRSMLVGDAVGNQSRWAALGAALEAAQSELAKLSDDLLVKAYAFAGSIEPIAVEDGRLALGSDPPEGEETALGAALEEVLQREQGQRLAGVILLSDGAQRASPERDLPPQTPARRLADLGYPLYAFCLGQPRASGQSRDVALDDLQLSSPAVFVKNRLNVRAMLRVEGYVHQQVPVQLLFESPSGEMTVVDAATLAASQDGQTLACELGYVPTVPGEYKVTVRAVEQPGELVKTNNQQSTFVNVLKGGLSILYVEGALRVEQKFIRRALDRAVNIKVDYVYLDPAGKAPSSALSERLAGGAYDVYLIGDVDSAAFSEEQLAQIARRVTDGAGLLMLGGLHSFGPGGYGNTPLAEVLPVAMSAVERQRLDEPPRADLHLAGEIKLQPTELGRRHFVTVLGSAAEDQAVWQQLPPLEGANRFRELTPRANVLVAGAKGEPILVAQDVGRGRALAFAGDSTWRWSLAGQALAHQRFWRQAILWLAHKEQAAQTDLWVDLDPRRYGLGRRVEFNAGARGPNGDPLPDLTWEAQAILPDGSQQNLQLAGEGDLRRGVFAATAQPGDYKIRVTASQGGQLVGTAQARFLVYSQDLELDNPAADPTLLASLAATTRGQALPPEQLVDLLGQLRRQPPPLEIERQTRQSLWDTGPFLLAFVGLLCGEWYLRKRWGLV